MRAKLTYVVRKSMSFPEMGNTNSSFSCVKFKKKIWMEGWNEKKNKE